MSMQTDVGETLYKARNARIAGRRQVPAAGRQGWSTPPTILRREHSPADASILGFCLQI